MAILLLILSVAPVIFFGYLIYKRDFDKEPTASLVKLFFCGVGSTFLTLIITGIMTAVIPFFGYDTTSLNIIELIPYVFVGIALVEEFSKWIFVYKLEYNDREFNHLYDGIVYAAFVALGFACFENILYVTQFGIQTAIVRAFLAIPGHLCDGIMMGYYLSMAKLALINKNPSLSKKNIALSLIVPTIAHGLYDYLIYASEIYDIFMLFFLAFVIAFFAYAAKKVKQLSNNYYNLDPTYITERQRKQMMTSYYNYQGNAYNGVYPQPNNNYQQPGNVQYGQVPYNGQYGQTTYQNVVASRYCPNCGAVVTGKYCNECGKEV